MLFQFNLIRDLCLFNQPTRVYTHYLQIGNADSNYSILYYYPKRLVSAFLNTFNSLILLSFWPDYYLLYSDIKKYHVILTLCINCLLNPYNMYIHNYMLMNLCKLYSIWCAYSPLLLKFPLLPISIRSLRSMTLLSSFMYLFYFDYV